MIILMKNSHFVNVDDCITADILVKDGFIEKIGDSINCSADVTIDATGLVALPGLFDMHVHLRDPGFTDKETILTGCKAAAAGGVTSLACMPNTLPVIDSTDTVEYIKQTAQSAVCDVFPISAITVGQNGDRLVDFKKLYSSGAIAFSDDGRWVSSEQLMIDALNQSEQLGSIVISHCELPQITADGIMHLGSVSKLLGVPGISRDSENKATARDIALAEKTGAKIHIAHVSTAQSADITRKAKKRGVRVTAETAPHYLCLTHDSLGTRDADYRMSPPLREKQDVDAMIKAVSDGTIDCIATDHAPHTALDKENFDTAPNGVVGLETSLSAAYTYLVKPGFMSLSQLVKCMADNPREILGLEPIQIKEGSCADICLFSEREVWTVEKQKLCSKSKNTPFKGMSLYGRVKYTIKDGRVVYKDN